MKPGLERVVDADRHGFGEIEFEPLLEILDGAAAALFPDHYCFCATARGADHGDRCGRGLAQPSAGLPRANDAFVAEQRDKAAPKALSFDRVVEDTLKAQIKR
jgi:hypothetical protein